MRDDYVAKPFGMLELLSRSAAAPDGSTRRRSSTSESCTRVPPKIALRCGGEDAVLTQKEFQMLCLLAENRGTVFSREQLISKVWAYGFDGETQVDVHIRTLRQKLGKCGEYAAAP